MHRLLKRQLRKMGLSLDHPPDKVQWKQLLENISQNYQQADDDRYLLERSLQISSDEMQALFRTQKASTEGRFQALLNAIPDLVFMLDEQGKYIEIIAGDETDLFLPLSELKNKYLHDIMPRSEADMFLGMISRAINDNTLQLTKYQMQVQSGARVFEGRVVPTGLKVQEYHTVLFLARDVTELDQTHEKLEHIATHDALTDLPNRVMMHKRLQQAISRAIRQESSAALMLMDLDHFKNINDSLGHSIGDSVLSEISQRLQKVSRVEDSVFRLGGDEFILLIEDLDDSDNAARIAGHILKIFKDPVRTDNMELEVTGSIGITMIPEDGEDSESLLRQADNAMYAAKESGRNSYHFYTEELGKKSHALLSLETRLRKAILNNELEIHYQPQFSLSNDELIGLEALVRWPTADPQHRSPEVFISIAEMSGLIETLGSWVIRQACLQGQDWLSRKLDFGRIAINLSSRQLNNPGLAEEVKTIMQETGMQGHRLELEMTETMVVHHGSTVLTNLEEFHSMGIQLAIDDFGTGHSSLINLKRFPLNRLKIDRSFVDGLGEDANDEVITSASIALARQLGYQVVAEGVETEKQADFLKQQNCDFAQGYLFARPMPAADVEKFIPALKIN